MIGKLASPHVHRTASRVTGLSVVLVIVLFFNIVFWTTLSHPPTKYRPYTSTHDIKAAVKHLELSHWYVEPTLETTTARHAFATFLADDSSVQGTDDPNGDKYFVATRILAYQLLHAPETRSQRHIPLVVLVSANVSDSKRTRLRNDGAIVHEVAPIESPWMITDVPEWQQVLTKLRVLELTQFERIAFLDADTVLTGPLETLFCDPAVDLQTTRQNAEAMRYDESSMPETYAFAAMVEMHREHGYPPTEENHDWPNGDYFNAGFFVVRPSLEMFNYYLSLTKLPNRFKPDLMEQNLLNYAHRPQGSMPWRMVDPVWNIHFPSLIDLQAGVRSLHVKWWAPEHENLALYLQGWKWRMEGFHEARDASRWDKKNFATTTSSAERMGDESCGF